MRRLTSGNGRNYHSGFTLTMVHSVILTRTSRSLPTGSGFGSVGSTGSGISGPAVLLAVTFSLAELLININIGGIQYVYFAGVERGNQCIRSFQCTDCQPAGGVVPFALVVSFRTKCGILVFTSVVLADVPFVAV